jgi:hypothetical protein
MDTVTVRLGTPRLPAVLSACGFVASVFVYIGSFAGTLVDPLFPWFFPLFIGCIALFLLTPAPAYRPFKISTFLSRESPRYEPTRVEIGSMVLLLIVLAHILWVVAHNSLGVAGIVDGKYVLESNGRIFKVLTRGEYLTERAAELRSFATVLIYLYFPPMMYWWFPPKDRPTN